MKLQAYYNLIAARYLQCGQVPLVISIAFIKEANDNRKTYERSRELHRHKNPLVTREEIEKGKVEAPLMTPQEIIDAAAKLMITRNV